MSVHSRSTRYANQEAPLISTVHIIGIDAAVDARATGLASAVLSHGTLTVERAQTASKQASAASLVASWLSVARGPVLLAIDAPLGWPVPLRSIGDHEAGQAIRADANSMFRRRTDRRIAERLGQQSLDIGADRIARTAHASLRLLEELRELTGRPIPLAWSHSGLGLTSAIEVYPAASLRAWGVPHRGYKKPEQRGAREKILSALPLVFGSDANRESLLGDADVLDAAICTVCAADFIAGRCEPPQDAAEARVEGWIWAAVA